MPNVENPPFPSKVEDSVITDNECIELHQGELASICAGVVGEYDTRYVIVVRVETTREEVTRKGTHMAFLTIRDATGLCEATVLPNVYSGKEDLFTTGTLLRIVCSTRLECGTYGKPEGQVAIFVEDAEPIT